MMYGNIPQTICGHIFCVYVPWTVITPIALATHALATPACVPYIPLVNVPKHQSSTVLFLHYKTLLHGVIMSD
jgi:hypothetical protein